ncbi:MAG: hypothetical protein HY917_04250 [Candidatus Diapherotrites archaeon]|nr:hypothetical protein [Candidatus Diapherotrites archaeon]
MNAKRKINRKCCVCGKAIYSSVNPKGRYSNGHYFGKFKIPIEGTGKYEKIGKTRPGKIKCNVVRWNGKERSVEYWECNSCFEEAGHLNWLEAKIGKLYGKKCPDFEPECIVCQAWKFYEEVLKGDEE